MKTNQRNMLIASAATAVVAGIVTYFIRRRNNRRKLNNENHVSPQSHHMTDVFSRAKQHATAH